MSACRNQECVNGRCPGVVIAGKGNARNPILGAKMRWAWVNCLACSRSEDQAKAGAVYKHQNRSPQEIAQRAQLATERAIYVKPQVPNRLAAVHALATHQSPPGNGIAIGAQENTAQLSKLLDQVTKLTEQITELLSENRELRKQLQARGDTSVIAGSSASN
jgi:hypothetical protein